MSTIHRSRPAGVEAAAPAVFRADIQGLRAIAVGLVVIYHLWPQRLTGGFIGVDVFFVISGFLITSHLLRHPPRKTSDFIAFWARRIRRLLPASLLVLVVTLLATRLVAPETLWSNVGKQVIAAALYAENWALGITNVDYLAADNAPTPVQHYWSLSVEEQFYVFWPLAIAFLWWLGLRWKKNSFMLLGLGIAAIILTSLTYSIYSTITNPGWAYFATTARVWELAIGGATALLVMRYPNVFGLRARIFMAWAGIFGILAAAILFDEATPFPGILAMIPVISTAAVIAAASTHKLSAHLLLSPKPMQFLGGISFSVYLWHWPIIILMPYVSGTLGWLDKTAALLLTLLLATLTKTFVEDRFRLGGTKSGSLPAFKFAAIGMAIVVAAGSAIVVESAVQTRVAQDRATAALSSNDVCFGAAAVVHGIEKCPTAQISSLIPQPAAAATDKSDAYADGCWSSQPYTDKPICTYGSGKKRVALVGNSHAGQWLPALQEIADTQDWTIDTYLIDRCNPTTTMLQFDATIKAENCLAYGKWVLEKTSAPNTYDMIVTSERQSLPVVGASWKQTESLAKAAYVDYLTEWEIAGLNVAVIKDPPYPGNSVPSIPDCIATNPDKLDRCSGTPEEWRWMDPLTDAAIELGSPTVKVVDLDEFFCIDGQCLPAIGSVITYFDGSHVTATYARSIAPFLERKLELIDWG